ncbi:MAG TPA: hypothetical protein VNN72_22270 [Polyangiaceae bacterium]|nr:hypothetical protein [Polyangiaceae bacterium]
MSAPVSSRARRSGALVALATEGALVPASCACCGEPAARGTLTRGRVGSGLIVGYCDDCSAHVGRDVTRRLSGVVASSLLGGGLALSLPFADRPPSIVALSLYVLVAAIVPVVVVVLWPRRPAPGHSADGPAARFVADGMLLCANDRYAAELARANGAKHELATFRERRFAAWLLVPAPLCAAAGVATLVITSPLVRVVNLGTERVTIDVDGRRIVAVDPTSVENASAGAEVRITAGEHELVARTAAGRELERTHVRVEGGHPHLFAPGSEGYCFWLESAEYGRGRANEPLREPLEGTQHFWVLPPDLGGFFRPVPEQARAETRLTGGTVTVLRQAPCGADP